MGISEEFDEIFNGEFEFEDVQFQKRAEMCYDMLVHNFYNNIIGYRNGFADREITSENTDCYFLETSDGLVPVGYYREIRPVESVMLTQGFINECISRMSPKRKELFDNLEMEVVALKEKCEETKDKKHSTHKKALISLSFGVLLMLITLVAFVWAGGFGIFSREALSGLSEMERSLPVLRRASVFFAKAFTGVSFITFLSAAVFSLVQFFELKQIKEKEAAYDLICNFNSYISSVNEDMETDCTKGIEDIRLAVRQGHNNKVEKNSAFHKIEALKNKLNVAKKYAKYFYVYIDVRITAAVIALCVIMSLISYTGLVPAIVEVDMYKDAADLMEDGNYFGAVAIFESLGNYKDSEGKIRECKYLMASEYIRQREGSKAKEILLEIGEYKDSGSLMTECDYLIAANCLKLGDIDTAYTLFTELGNYKGSKHKLELTKEKIYERGINWYDDGQYDDAKKDFERSVNCGREKDYLYLIKARKGKLKSISKLLTLIDFEDTKDILKRDEYLPEFLIGSWSCKDKNITFAREEDKITCSQNLFESELRDIRFLSGVMSAGSDKVNKFKFSIIDENTVKVLEYANFKWYEFTRD